MRRLAVAFAILLGISLVQALSSPSLTYAQEEPIEETPPEEPVLPFA